MSPILARMKLTEQQVIERMGVSFSATHNGRPIADTRAFADFFLKEFRSAAARKAALARWAGTYKADRQRYARAIRQGKPAPRVRKWKRRKKSKRNR